MNDAGGAVAVVICTQSGCQRVCARVWPGDDGALQIGEAPQTMSLPLAEGEYLEAPKAVGRVTVKLTELDDDWRYWPRCADNHRRMVVGADVRDALVKARRRHAEGVTKPVAIKARDRT